MNNIWNTAIVTEDGILFKAIRVGDKCTFGQRAILMPGCEAGHHVTLGAESDLRSGTYVQDSSTVFGCPPIIFVQTAPDSENVRQLQEQVSNFVGQSTATPGPVTSVLELRETASKIADGQTSIAEGPYTVGSTSSNRSTSLELPPASTPNMMLAACALYQLIMYPVVFAAYAGLYVLIFDWPLRHMVTDSPWWLILFIPVIYTIGTFLLATLLCIIRATGVSQFNSGATSFYTWRFFTW